MQNVSFQDLVDLFPVVLAPALVARIRRDMPRIDGWYVWLAVVAAAVLFSIALNGLFGQLPSLAIVRQGVALGLISAGIHTLFKRGPRFSASVAVPTSDAAPTEPNLGPPAVSIEPSSAWGPAPSGPER